MWTEEMFLECVAYFERLSEEDPIAGKFLWLLRHIGAVPMYEVVPAYNRVIEVILTQRISFTRSNKMRRALSALMGKREFLPEDLLVRIETDRASLRDIGMEDYVVDICREASLFASTFVDSEMTVEDIEEMAKSTKGFSEWSVNVACINITFSEAHPGLPYDALTNRDPVVKRGLYWLTGIDPYESVVDEFSSRYSPYAGVMTRYIWEAFNYGRIKVKLPVHYKKWNNRGKCNLASFVNRRSQLDELLERGSK